MKNNKGRSTRHKGVKALGSGRYRLRLYVTDPVTGRQREVVKTVEAKSVKDAVRLRQVEELRLRNERSEAQQTDLHGSMTFGDVADAWLRLVTEKKLEDDPTQMHLCPYTRDRYMSSVINFLKPYYGRMRTDRISVEHIRRWREDLLGTGYARSTINGHHRVLKSILRAVGNDSATKVKSLNEKPDARISRKDPNLLTSDELDRFLAVAWKRWPQHYALILVLFTTTVRIATALALRWEDLDLETMEIVVQRRLSGSGKRVEVIPGVKRDRHGEDTPPLLPEVHEALQVHRATFNDAQRSSGLLFPSPRTGRHQARTVLSRPFEDICKHAGITKRFTPHGCRRTGAKLYGRTSGTRMAMRIAGHMTEAMHEHYAPVDAAEKLEAGRRAFGALRLLQGTGGGSDDETGTQTGTRGVSGQGGGC